MICVKPLIKAFGLVILCCLKKRVENPILGVKFFYMRSFFNFIGIILALTACLWMVGVYVLVDWVVPQVVVQPHYFAKASGEITDYPQPEKEIAEVYEKWTLDQEGLKLKAMLLAPRAPKACIILLHGIKGKKEHWIGTAKWLNENGYATLIPDHRAHGESEGQYITFGYKEKQDVSAWANALQKRFPNVSIGIWGNSLGGAIGLQALAADKRFTFGIIESTFADLNDVVFAYGSRLFGLRYRFLSNRIVARAGIFANFEPQAVKPAQSAKNIHQPILYLHGTADDNINIQHGYRIFRNLASPHKRLFVVEGGKHWGLAYTAGKAYSKTLLQFLKLRADG
jgi:uncharacterized protein